MCSKMYCTISSYHYSSLYPFSIHSIYQNTAEPEKRTLALLLPILFGHKLHCKKQSQKKILIRLFQSIRHQGSEQVSKPDIHHVDFL
jgi:hypothetical protein